MSSVTRREGCLLYLVAGLLWLVLGSLMTQEVHARHRESRWSRFTVEVTR